MILDNPRHELFARQVADGISQSDAYVNAGFSQATASAGAARLVKKSLVSARICELRVKSVEDSRVDSAFLLSHLGEILKADIGDILESETIPGPTVLVIVEGEAKLHTMERPGPPARVKGQFKPIHDWPKIWRQMLKGIDIEELNERSKDGGDTSWDVIGRVVKIKFIDTLKAMELLGQHIDVRAWEAPVQDIHVHVDLFDRLSAGRKRLLEDHREPAKSRQ